MLRKEIFQSLRFIDNYLLNKTIEVTPRMRTVLLNKSIEVRHPYSKYNNVGIKCKEFQKPP
jgi:hypothetical protein